MTDHKNIAVLTTKGVFFENMPISYVFRHADDGMWEFRENKDKVQDSEIRVVSLEEVINRDKTIREILDLPLGYYAFRIDCESQWEIKPIQTELLK
ncbi:DUF2185 domain-containing protein [Sphingobacterium faecale]|uniref:DUF2185 domain-containing protein n=1 Tax=Sphingobacterium faecale TaxID=2803775 RepID=A0ABS1R8N6_9SPHI|nr:DUF2185 domain-containing protein [Sphingobacterium faecale]MBL1411081.1 DUF2185 domain-containing protein [Sphingobacterium faecale]